MLTQYQRKKASRRFHKTVLNLGGEECDVFVEGNLMHRESLLAELLKNTEVWDGKLYKAENVPHRPGDQFPVGNTKEDGSPLWPERWPAQRLAARRTPIDRASATGTRYPAGV